MKILLIEDQVLLSTTLTKALEQVPDFQVVAQSDKAVEALKLCEKFRPDIVIRDIFTAEGNGLDYISCIKQKFPNIKVLIITGVENEQLLLAAEKAGADLFAWKNIQIDELTDLIRYSKKPYRVFPNKLSQTKQRINLSDIEIKIIKLLSQGKSTKEIAAELYLEYGTIRVYISHMFTKIGVKSRAQLVAYASNCGLITP